MPFFELRSKSSDAMQEIQNNNPDAWLDSFIFIIIPNGEGCMLLRSVKAIDKSTGQTLQDFTNRDIWSMEGLWCPAEKMDIFTASLPLILNRFRELGKPLHELYDVLELSPNEKTSRYLEIDDEQLANIYSDRDISDLQEKAAPLLSAENDALAMKALISRLRTSSKPFSFAFGPFADVIMGYFARGYNLSASFPTFKSGDYPEPRDELFDRVVCTKIVERHPASTKEYRLLFGADVSNRKEMSYSWKIMSVQEAEKEPLYMESIKAGDFADGISFVNLHAEAEAVRAFMISRYFTTDNNPRATGYYTFGKEE
jgi:hypothetical protein